jgi:hypothetical protein
LLRAATSSQDRYRRPRFGHPHAAAVKLSKLTVGRTKFLMLCTGTHSTSALSQPMKAFWLHYTAHKRLGLTCVNNPQPLLNELRFVDETLIVDRRSI